jgi:NADPH:quinone reductase-like Zn-dependent oxidoreductase
MKAAIFHRNGPPEVVGIEEIEKPVPKGNEVLVKVRAASVNSVDYHVIKVVINVAL